MIQRFKFRKVFIFAILITFVLNPFFTHLQVFAHENINDKDIGENVITLYDLNLEEDEEFTTLYCEELDRKSEVIDINNEELTEYFKELDINVIDEELKTFINSLEIECEISSEDENKDVDDELTLSDEDKNSSSSNNTETDNNNSSSNSTVIEGNNSSSNVDEFKNDSNDKLIQNNKFFATEKDELVNTKEHDTNSENNKNKKSSNIKKASIKQADNEKFSMDEYTNGDKGPHVIQLKKDLRQLGYGNFPANPSNVYGSVTANVVKSFQKDNGL
ncbi:peptidoglycan-binding domain-containing protein, partial [Pseudogracilibacillus sp. SO10305]|uniref:peptidoglycan-binding domain-containing protein n=1 Tax=Pseudogracilibacillus sp. SO10305 TaxID=3098292 RepID=UPI00300DC977